MVAIWVDRCSKSFRAYVAEGGNAPINRFCENRKRRQIKLIFTIVNILVVLYVYILKALNFLRKLAFHLFSILFPSILTRLKVIVLETSFITCKRNQRQTGVGKKNYLLPQIK